MFLFFLSYYFVHPFSVLDSRPDAFASSDCWKIRKSLILLQRSAVGRRKRKIRTETGEKKNVCADALVTKTNLTHLNLLTAQKAPPLLLGERKRSQKRRKRNGILECTCKCLDAYFAVTHNSFYFSDASVDEQDNR